MPNYMSIKLFLLLIFIYFSIFERERRNSLLHQWTCCSFQESVIICSIYNSLNFFHVCFPIYLCIYKSKHIQIIMFPVLLWIKYSNANVTVVTWVKLTNHTIRNQQRFQPNSIVPVSAEDQRHKRLKQFRK